MGKSMRTLPEKKCLYCKKEIVGRWHKPVQRDKRFCSQSCYFAFKGETSIEETVREYLTVNHIRCLRQYQVGKYFADLYIPDHNLVIEVDGEYWHGKKGKPANVIETRERYFAQQGFYVLHIPESAIKSGRYQKKISEALSEIQSASSKDNENRTAFL
jgi:very-short-patch-repair endonuclease